MIGRLKNLFQSRKAAEAFPERVHRLYVSEEGVTLYPTKGPRQFLPWDALERVEVRTTMLSEGAENVYWLLWGGGGGMVIPNGAEGTEDLLVWLQRLPGWDGNTAIAAMSSVVDGEHVCWRR